MCGFLASRISPIELSPMPLGSTEDNRITIDLDEKASNYQNMPTDPRTGQSPPAVPSLQAQEHITKEARTHIFIHVVPSARIPVRGSTKMQYERQEGGGRGEKLIRGEAAKCFCGGAFPQSF
jgi:hypothetical protein